MSITLAQARAEQGLLCAFSVPRATVGKNPLIKSQAGTLTEIATGYERCSGEP